MTPMIDVLLVLIILFMVITPLTSTGLPALVPQSPPPGAEHRPRLRDIVVTVGKGGLLQINGERVGFAALPERMAQIFRARGDGVIFVRGDGDLEFERIARVIDITRGAGFEKMALDAVD